MSRERRQEWYSRLEQALEVPMMILSLAVVPVLVVPYVADLPNQIDKAFWLFGSAVWGLFAVELVAMTYLAPNRFGHLRRHWYEVPIVVVPFLRPFRLLRSARALRALRATRLLAFASRATGSVRYVLQRHGLQYVLLGGTLLYVLAAAVVTVFERGSGGTINTFPDALWWGITTMTSLRNDDAFPVTREGKFVAVFVALLGLSLVGIITANIAAFLLRSTQSHDRNDFEAVLDQLNQIEKQLGRLHPQLGDGAPAIVNGLAAPDLISSARSPALASESLDP